MFASQPNTSWTQHCIVPHSIQVLPEGTNAEHRSTRRCIKYYEAPQIKHSPKKRPVKCYGTSCTIFIIFIWNHIFCKSGHHKAVLTSLLKTRSLHLQQVQSSREKQTPVARSREAQCSFHLQNWSFILQTTGTVRCHFDSKMFRRYKSFCTFQYTNSVKPYKNQISI